MRTEIELKNTIQRAQRAEQLLNDPMIQEFIITVRGDLLNKFESTDLNSEAERLAAWNQAQVLKLFVSKFTKEIKSGKDARSLLEQSKHTVRNII
tara:strand:- start:15766 stop:16050 length:285 start_codon:yes stop_codon:yes gene_type:complete